MKDFCKIKEYKNVKFFYNKKDQYHRLNGPAEESLVNGESVYYINGSGYMSYYDGDGLGVHIYTCIIELLNEYSIFIKNNINALIEKYNPIFTLSDLFTKEEINQLPNFIKDLIIL